jgi:hypothetical protein
MKIENFETVVQISPTRIPSPHIADFLQERLHVDTQSPRVWYRIDNFGHITDTVIIEEHQNLFEDVVLHVRDLMDFAPLSNLLLEDSNSTGSDNESMQLCRG